MIKTDFLDNLRKFSLIVKKRVTSNYSGPKRSISSGQGLTFKDFRIYAPGDDIRRIDWRVYARTDDLYVKDYEEERNLTVHIIVDYSASMNYGKPFTKYDYAAMIGVGFAYLAMKDNEKFMFSTFSEELNVFQPRKGMHQLVSMVNFLNNLKTDGYSKIAESMMKYKRFIDSRSMIVIISDFLINLEEINHALYLLGEHDVKVIQVLDPVEKDLRMTGNYKLKDSETKQKLRTYITQRLRMEYHDMLDQHVGKIHDTCNKLGYDFFQVTTDKPVFDVFYELLE
jgi:uncharacterized protein (DUF58 family)